MFKSLGSKMAAVSAFVTTAFVSTANAQEASALDGLTSAQTAITGDIATIGGVLLAIAVAGFATFYILKYVPKR